MGRMKLRTIPLITAALLLTLGLGRARALPAVSSTGIANVVTDEPGATLLIPYFEVDLNNRTSQGDTTVISITNTSATAILAHWVIWTDLGIPAIEFNVYLTGYDVYRMNLQNFLETGNAPQTASAGQDPTDRISPKGEDSQDINFASCTNMLPYGNLPAAQLQGLQNALTGQPSVNYGGNCGGQNIGDGIARGYITIDTVNSCSTLFPGESGYIGSTGGGPVITNQNVMTGDYWYLNPSKNHAVGLKAVSLWAEPTNPSTSTPGMYTFWGAADNWNADDDRVPTATNFAARYFAPGVSLSTTQAMNYVNQGTDQVIWRDSKVNGVSANPMGFACNGPKPAWFPLTQEGLLLFDEQENPQEPSVGNLAPARTQRLNAKVLGSTNEGWQLLDLNQSNTEAGSNPSTDPNAAQAWSSVLYDQGTGPGPNSTSKWEMGQDGFPLDSAGNANHTLPGAH